MNASMLLAVGALALSFFTAPAHAAHADGVQTDTACDRPASSPPRVRTAGALSPSVVHCETVIVQAASATSPTPVPAPGPALPAAPPASADLGPQAPRATSPGADQPAAGGWSIREVATASTTTVALALAAAGLWLLLRVLADADNGPAAPASSLPGFGFRRHWGSFGGESTGWNMSLRLARLVSGLAMVGASTLLLFLLMGTFDPPPKPSTDTPAGSGSKPATWPTKG